LPASAPNRFRSTLHPFEDFKDTDTIRSGPAVATKSHLQDYDYLKERATLIAKLGAKARGRPPSQAHDQVLQDVWIGATSTTPRLTTVTSRMAALYRFGMTSPRTGPMWARTSRRTFPAGNAIGGRLRCGCPPLSGVEAVKGTVFGIPQDNLCDPAENLRPLTLGLWSTTLVYFTATSKTDENFNDAVRRSSAS